MTAGGLLLLLAGLLTGEALGLEPNATHVCGLIDKDLNAEPFTPETMKLVEDLIGYEYAIPPAVMVEIDDALMLGLCLVDPDM